MRIITWNVNGFKSILQKGFIEFVEKENPDMLCLQEIRTRDFQLPLRLTLKGYDVYSSLAIERKGLWGVATLSKLKPLKIHRELGFERFDKEGRFLRLDFANFILINIYMPHGGRDKKNLDYKLASYDFLLRYLKRLINENVIIAGDFNVARSEIDLARPKENRNNIMFTPAERAKLNAIVELGFIDAFRFFCKEPGHYTWFPYFGNARERNLGWRIDYVFVSPSLKGKLRRAFILRDVTGSDHCPMGIEIEM